MNDSTEKQAVKGGTFLYDGLRICKVRILQTNFRPGSGDYGDPPEFKNDKYGTFFEVQYTFPREERFSVGGYFESLDEAVARVENALSGVEWDEANSHMGTNLPLELPATALLVFEFPKIDGFPTRELTPTLWRGHPRGPSGREIGRRSLTKGLWFIAVEKFDPSDEGWKKFIEGSGLVQLSEVIGLDSLLCPAVIKEASKEDRDHMVVGAFGGFYFRDRAYLTNRTKNMINKHLLAVVLEPDSDDQTRKIQGGHFLGHDLIDSVSGISALTNCGGFPGSFDNQELNKYGLISEYLRAKQIQAALLINNPDEPHADTELWAIWKLEE